MASTHLKIDRDQSARRIEHDVETLGGPEYTRSTEAICRYAYTPEYRRTLDYFKTAFESLGYDVYEDPVGNFVARNRPAGEPVFGIGSHCDSNRNGGKYDGTLGVVTALEVCRLNAEHGLDLPLQVISFLEEESSGFGVALLGSRIAAQGITGEELEGAKAIDDGRPFFEHAREAGYEPERWRESIEILRDLTGWIELHIEQARVLQDTGNRVGVVTAIAGITWLDARFGGRADHAGATPMGFRVDASIPAAQAVLDLERLVLEAGNDAVGTAGGLAVDPGLHNVIPGEARVGMDIRAPRDEVVDEIVSGIRAAMESAAKERGVSVDISSRFRLPATQMDAGIVAALEQAAGQTGEPFMSMPSGAAHDTMSIAEHVGTAMVFVPCKDGISHAPEESAEPADAAVAAEVILNAIREL